MSNDDDVDDDMQFYVYALYMRLCTDVVYKYV